MDSAIYVDGHRTGFCSLGEVRRISREREGFAWVELFEPSEEEFGLVTREFDLHERAVEDAIEAHQRPKVERYGDSVFVVLKYACYRDETETVEFGEIHVFLGPDFVAIVTGVYGMNFRYMPELSWTFGYPFALALIALISGLLFLGFRRAGWL